MHLINLLLKLRNLLLEELFVLLECANYRLFTLDNGLDLVDPLLIITLLIV